MIALADDNVALAREKMIAGLSQPSNTPPLAAFMQRVLAHLPAAATANDAALPASEMSLGAYQNSSFNSR